MPEIIIHEVGPRDGLQRDIDLDALIAVARDVAAYFDREMPGRVYKIGPLSYWTGAP